MAELDKGKTIPWKSSCLQMGNRKEHTSTSPVTDNQTPECRETEKAERLIAYRKRIGQAKRRNFLRICGSYCYPFRRRFTPYNFGHMYHMGALAGFVGFLLFYGWLFILLADLGVYLSGHEIVGTAVMVTGWAIVFLRELAFYIRHIRSA